MTDATSDGSQVGVGGQGRRRTRQPVRRTRRVEVTLTGEEYTIIEAAARRAGLARRAYIAQAVLAAAANGGPLGDRESLRRALIELMRAAGLVRRTGTNINQAAAITERLRAARRGPARLRRRDHPPRRSHGRGCRRRAQGPGVRLVVVVAVAG